MAKKRSSLRWPGGKEANQRLQGFQDENRAIAARNPNEQWMFEKLRRTGYKWTPQARWGYRMFDFWCAPIGIAIEVDGPEHDGEYDTYRDKDALDAFGIIVLRVRNKNEEDAHTALAFINVAEFWNARLDRLGYPRRHNGELTPKAAALRDDVLAGKRELPKPYIRVREVPAA